MGKIAIVTDSNSGVTKAMAEKMGIYVISMPFYINGSLYLEEETLTQNEFYEYLSEDAEISTSMPAVASVTDFWDELLKQYDEIVHIPMSSGLSSACSTAIMLAQDYEGKVQVVDNHAISATLKWAARDAKTLADAGWSAKGIKELLEERQKEASIYITLSTLYYLKKGGRITPAAAALGTLLRLKPVLQIQGERLDAYAKCRTTKAAKTTMLEAIVKDCRERYGAEAGDEKVRIDLVYSGTDQAEILTWKEELAKLYVDKEMEVQPLSLSISCHIGPGALAITCMKALSEETIQNPR